MGAKNNQGKRKRSPWFAFYADDYIAGTRGMSIAARGAYIDLLAHQFSTGFIPGEDRKICRLIGAFPDEWEEIKGEVLLKFERQEDGSFVNLRMASERDQRESIRQKRINAVKKRWRDDDTSVSTSDDTSVSTCVDACEYPNGDTSTSTSTSTKKHSLPSAGFPSKEDVLDFCEKQKWSKESGLSFWLHFDEQRSNGDRSLGPNWHWWSRLEKWVIDDARKNLNQKNGKNRSSSNTSSRNRGTANEGRESQYGTIG